MTTSEVAKQLVAVDPADAVLGGALVGEVLAPGDDVHAERLTDPRDLAAQPAEADDAEPGAGEVAADGLLPAAGADGGVLLGDVPRDREDQRPGELGGGRSAWTPVPQTVMPCSVAAGDVDRLVAPRRW